MVTRLLLIFLCLGVLSTVTGCYVEPTSYGTSSSGGGTDDERRQDRKQGEDRMKCIIRGTPCCLQFAWRCLKSNRWLDKGIGTRQERPTSSFVEGAPHPQSTGPIMVHAIAVLLWHKDRAYSAGFWPSS